MGNEIIAERSSVCMGDDCLAPNRATLKYEDGEKLSAFLLKVADYVPAMSSTVWTVESDGKVIAYLDLDENAKASYKVCRDDIYMKDIPGQRIFCRYYSSKSGFYLRYNTDGTEKPRLSKEEIKAKAKQDNAAAVKATAKSVKSNTSNNSNTNGNDDKAPGSNQSRRKARRGSLFGILRRK